MVASLFDKLHSPEYWVADVIVPGLFGLLLTALVMSLFRLRPSWTWVNVAAGAYLLVSIVVMIAAYRSGFVAIFGERGHVSFPSSWESTLQVVDFFPNLLSALFPIFCVLIADDLLPPVAQKIVKLLQAAVAAVAAGAAVYIFADGGWSQPSFHLASFAQIAGADVGGAGL